MTETWFTSAIDDDLTQIQGYSLFRNDRNDSRRGGGTAVYAAISARACPVDLPSYFIRPSCIEMTLIQYTDFDAHVSYLLCVYIPPGLSSDTVCEFKQYIIDCFDHLLCANPESTFYVCGDFNRYNISFLYENFELCNIVDIPTFGNATLDKFLCHEYHQNTFSISTAPSLGTASNTHSIVLVSRNLTVKNDHVHYHKLYDLRKSHVSAFHRCLQRSDWSLVYHCDSIEDSVKHFYDLFYSALSIIPVSFVKFTSRTKPWITPVVIDIINKRWLAYRNKDFVLYNHYKQKVKKEIFKSKLIWSRNMRNSSRGVWSVVNDVRNKTNDNSINKIVNLFSDPAEAANSINTQFSSVFVSRSDFPVLPVDVHASNICNEASVYNLLNRLNTSKACGSDGIHSIFLKMSADVICSPVCHIINSSFASGVFPKIWKIADVFPLPKCTPVKKDALRPISLLPVLSKICERIVLNKFGDNLVQLYDDFQFAYRPKSSTVCALVTLHDLVLKMLDDVNIAAVRIVTFDMSNAFDRVPHHLLLSTISNCDFFNKNAFVNWLNDYLIGREQRVKLGTVRSNIAKVTSGVPQGSIIGPFLFAVYMSTYKPCNLHSYVVKYADDVVILLPVFKNAYQDQSVIRTEMVHFESWCSKYGMFINKSKTKVLTVNFSKLAISNVSDFVNVTVLKFLGLHFNSKLTWTNHFEYVARKVSQRLYILRVLKNILSHDELVLVFNAVIRSLMEYASPVFLNPGIVLDHSFLSLCKRAFRIIHGTNVKICESCNMLNLVDRRKALSLKLFKQVIDSHDHVLRKFVPRKSAHSNRLILPTAKSKRRTDGFFFAASKLYNGSLRRLNFE